jgi:hypothetical protein
MTKALRNWTVLPHQPIERIGSRLLSVTGDLRMPLTTLQRRMTVVRLNSGKLVIYSAIALADAAMQELEAFGTPAFLVVPNHLHRRDAFIWKQRYPDLVVVAPSGARASVAEVVPVDTSRPDFADASVRFVELEGTGGREAALEVVEHESITLVLNDIVGNLPRSSGIVLRALGFAGPAPRVPRAVRRLLIKDAKAVRAQFERWAREPVERILVSHGQPILEDAPNVLRRLAASL